MLTAVGNRLRLRVIAELAEGRVHVSELARRLGISRPLLYMHLDRLEKAAEYAAFGVRYYWLVDPDDRTFEIFELDAHGRYARLTGVADGQLDVPGCEGLRLDLDAIWARIDRLA